MFSKSKTIAVFGSFAHIIWRNASDVDVLVEISSPVGIEFIDLGNYLERLLNIRVDLVSRSGIEPKYYNIVSNNPRYV